MIKLNIQWNINPKYSHKYHYLIQLMGEISKSEQITGGWEPDTYYSPNYDFRMDR